MHRRAKPKKAKAEAKRPLIRKPPDDGAKVRDLEKRLAETLKREEEALEQQTATSEILGVISQSPTDVQPVFDAIARHGVALCGGVGSVVVRYDGSVMQLAASHNVSSLSRELHETYYPRPLDPTVPLG